MYENEDEVMEVSNLSEYKRGRLPKLEIFRDYIFGYVESKKNGDFDIHYPTVQELAEKYNVSYNTLSNLVTREDWRKIKTASLARIRKTATKVEIAQILSISSTLDSRVLQNVEKVHDIATKFLDKIENRIDEVDEMDILMIDKIPNALEKITRIVEKSSAISRKILGDDEHKEGFYDDIERIVENAIEDFGELAGGLDVKQIEAEIEKIRRTRMGLDTTMEDKKPRRLKTGRTKE
jgi:hypothetical protein